MPSLAPSVNHHSSPLLAREATSRARLFFNPELMAKRLELLKELAMPMSRVAVLLNADNPLNNSSLSTMDATAKPLGMALQEFFARGPNEFENTFADIANQQFDGVVIADDPTFISNSNLLALQALRRRLPSIGYLEFAAAGGLMAYGIKFYDLFCRAGCFVDRILKGANPGDLPVEQPTKFELVINLKPRKRSASKSPRNCSPAPTRSIE